MATLTTNERHKLLLEWLELEAVKAGIDMREIDSCDSWTDEQADLYEELEYRRDWIIKELK
jgi:hypothetical protein